MIREEKAFIALMVLFFGAFIVGMLWLLAL